MGERARKLRETLVDRAVNGPATSGPAARRAAFANEGVDPRARGLIDKVARHAWDITDDDVAEVKRAGVPEEEIFELAVCAALGQATRQLEAALAAVDAATRTDRTDPTAVAGKAQGES